MSKLDRENNVEQFYKECKHLTMLIQDLKPSIKDTSLSNKGISLLELKNELFTNYITFLMLQVYKKLSHHCEVKELEYGASENNQETLHNDDSPKKDQMIGSSNCDSDAQYLSLNSKLWDIKGYIEMVRPIEGKLKYVINKAIQSISLFKDGEKNADVCSQPRPDNFIIEDSEEEESGLKNASEKVSKKYVPPKIAPMRCEESNFEQIKEKYERKEVSAKKRMMSSSMFLELKDQFDDAPEEQNTNFGTRNKAYQQKLNQKEKYEEDNLIRLPASKKERHKVRQFQDMETLDEIVNFGNFYENMCLSAENKSNAAKSSYSRRTKRSSSKGKKKNKIKKFQRK